MTIKVCCICGSVAIRRVGKYGYCHKHTQDAVDRQTTQANKFVGASLGNTGKKVWIAKLIKSTVKKPKRQGQG